MNGSAHRTPAVLDIQLRRGPAGLGFNIVGGVDQQQLMEDSGIYVAKIKENGAAALDGRLREGDKILAINGHRLENLPHSAAVELFRSAGEDVLLQVEQRSLLTANGPANSRSDGDSFSPVGPLVFGLLVAAVVAAFVYHRRDRRDGHKGTGGELREEKHETGAREGKRSEKKQKKIEEKSQHREEKKRSKRYRGVDRRDQTGQKETKKDEIQGDKEEMRAEDRQKEKTRKKPATILAGEKREIGPTTNQIPIDTTLQKTTDKPRTEVEDKKDHQTKPERQKERGRRLHREERGMTDRKQKEDTKRRREEDSPLLTTTTKTDRTGKETQEMDSRGTIAHLLQDRPPDTQPPIARRDRC
ncbi:hypothetical protein NFI96_020887 [Prochilodus magdalenae]|nr:hypothetical protein NFI96_020887 [Prochilodus magdalenae]